MRSKWGKRGAWVGAILLGSLLLAILDSVAYSAPRPTARPSLRVTPRPVAPMPKKKRAQGQFIPGRRYDQPIPIRPYVAPTAAPSRRR